MSTTYKTVTGDTLENISRRFYGVETNTGLILSANPGVTVPLLAGVTLVIPATPLNVNQSLPQETIILIDGFRFRFWEQLRFTRSIDTISTLEFSVPIDEAFRDIFKPFQFKPIKLAHDGQVIFNGTVIGVTPSISADGKRLQVACYGLPGVLADCTTPPPAPGVYDAYEFTDITLKDAAEKLCQPFGVNCIFRDPPGAPIDQIKIEEGEKILSFLAKWAKQRNLVISDDKDGNLIFQQSISTGTPVAHLKQGISPGVSINPFFDPQEYYSSVSGIDPMMMGDAGSVHTVKNPRLPNVFRPYIFRTSDNTGASVVDATNSKAGRMFANMVNYSVGLATWFDKSGKLWEPNTIVKMNAPDAMVYSDYDFLIRSIAFEKSSDGGESATLDLIIPGTFAGKMPERLPWD